MCVLSIIIPSYNSASLIERNVRSLSFTIEYEIIIVDDGSTDDTRDKVNEMIKENHNIKYIFQENQGVSAARNNGLNFAKGKFIYFIDSDDYLINIESLNRVLQSSHEADLIVFGYFLENELFVRNEKKFEESFKYYLPKDFESFLTNHFLKTEYRGAVWNKIYRKSIIFDHNLKFKNYSEVWSEDSLFNLEYILSKSDKSILIHNQSYLVHEYHEGSLSNSKIQKNINSRMINTLQHFTQLLHSEENENLESLYNFYNVNYLLKFAIASIVINKNSFEIFRKDIAKIIEESISRGNERFYEKPFQQVFDSNIQYYYYYFLHHLISKRKTNLLSVILWARYKISYRA